MRTLTTLLAVLMASAAAIAKPSFEATKRIQEAATVLQELHAIPDKDIPQDLWNNAACVVVVPSLKKAAFSIGGEYGKGLMSCRRAGGWSAPVFMQIGKGSWGAQIGAESIDLVLLVMNNRGMEKLLQDKVSLGAGVSVAVGPLGRHAQAGTDAQMNAEILSYSRAQGLFAGIDLSGGVVTADDDDNHDLYGKEISARQGLMQGVANAPSATQPFMRALRRERSN